MKNEYILQSDTTEQSQQINKQTKQTENMVQSINSREKGNTVTSFKDKKH